MTQRLSWAALAFVFVLPAAAHEGHDEGEAPTPARPQAGGQALEASSAAFEAVLKFDPLVPGHQQQLKLFLSDFATNAPVAGAAVKGVLGESQAVAFKPLRPGIYEAHVSLTEAGPVDLALSIDAGGRQDLLVLEGLPVGGAAGPGPIAAPGYLWPLLGGTVLLLLAGLWWRRRRKKYA